jgi:hypothetical protein
MTCFGFLLTLYSFFPPPVLGIEPRVFEHLPLSYAPALSHSNSCIECLVGPFSLQTFFNSGEFSCIVSLTIFCLFVSYCPFLCFLSYFPGEFFTFIVQLFISATDIFLDLYFIYLYFIWVLLVCLLCYRPSSNVW